MEHNLTIGKNYKCKSVWVWKRRENVKVQKMSLSSLNNKKKDGVLPQSIVEAVHLDFLLTDWHNRPNIFNCCCFSVLPFMSISHQTKSILAGWKLLFVIWWTNPQKLLVCIPSCPSLCFQYALLEIVVAWAMHIHVQINTECNMLRFGIIFGLGIYNPRQHFQSHTSYMVCELKMLCQLISVRWDTFFVTPK